MDDDQRSEYEAKSKQLRADLKQWESHWAKTHMGTKPSREDIKADSVIAQKYKDYNRARDVLAGKILPPPTKTSSGDGERKRPQTVSGAGGYAETPRKSRLGVGPTEGLMGTPTISRKLFSPASVRSMGPTPQRDGKVLGLFDLMVERELGTPSQLNADGGDLEAVPAARTPSRRLRLEATPRKRALEVDEESNTVRLGKTPMSSSKRHRLDHFMTPLKHRDGNAAGQKPSPSASKLQLDTPAFLKRHSLPATRELDDAFAGAVSAIRLPRKPLGRGLSEIVASLRKDEEDRLDAELDILHELEAEATGQSPNRPSELLPVPVLGTPPRPGLSQPEEEQSQNPTEKSQSRRMPLGGFDDEAMYDSPVEEGPGGGGGQPTRAFKKKGQKRTTRKVNMRPVRTDRPAKSTASIESPDGNVNSDDEGDDPVSVPETQIGGTALDGPGSASEWEDEDEAVRTAKPKAAASAQKKTKETALAAKKPGRKVNELAHANFHRLKLRNNGAKGGPGQNSKFRRRR